MGLWHCQGGAGRFFSSAGDGGLGSTVLPGGSGTVGLAWLFRRLLALAARLLYNKGSVRAEGAVSAGLGPVRPGPHNRRVPGGFHARTGVARGVRPGPVCFRPGPRTIPGGFAPAPLPCPAQPQASLC